MSKRLQTQPVINNSILTLEKVIDIHLYNDVPKTFVLKYFLSLVLIRKSSYALKRRRKYTKIIIGNSLNLT